VSTSLLKFLLKIKRLRPLKHSRPWGFQPHLPDKRTRAWPRNCASGSSRV